MKTIRIIAPALLTLALTACGGSGEKPTKEVVHSVMTVRPETTNGAQVKNFSGVVKENATMSLSFRAGGQIARILVKEGQHVSKGQLLATLDPKDYQLAVDNARVQLKQMQDQVNRYQPLYEKKAMNANDYDMAVSRRDMLEIQLRNAENQLSYTRLVAPVDGFVQAVNREVSEMVGVGSSVLELVDDRSREIEINVPNDVAREYSRYESAYCQYNGQQYPLQILSILHKADANQLYTVRLGVNAPLRPGQSVDVFINAGPGEQAALTLPTGAVFEQEGKSYVWVVKDGKVSRRAITLAQTVANGGHVTIASGLTGNEEVVKAGVNYLHDGEAVRVVTNESSNVGDLL